MEYYVKVKRKKGKGRAMDVQGFGFCTLTPVHRGGSLGMG
jgi:hypothetical protein